MATTKEKDRTILINFVLDKSGSMEVIREATISGFNEFKNDQANMEEGTAYLTLTLFDTGFHNLCTAVPAREVPDLDRDSYGPSGCTALYDAIGHTMGITDDFCARNAPDQVLFVIMSDGFENASQEFTREMVFQMIAERQASAGYEFIYLGANQDSYRVASDLGVREGRMLDFSSDAKSASDTFARVSQNVRAYRRYEKRQAPEMFSKEFEDMGTDEGPSIEEKRRRYQQDHDGTDAANAS